MSVVIKWPWSCGFCYSVIAGIIVVLDTPVSNAVIIIIIFLPQVVKIPRVIISGVLLKMEVDIRKGAWRRA